MSTVGFQAGRCCSRPQGARCRRRATCAAAAPAAAEAAFSDLFEETEFTAPARMLPKGRLYGRREGAPAEAAVHTVRIKARDSDDVFTVRAAEDRYILFEAEDQGFELPAACRMGCCTACAVKVTSGSVSQPQALGLSASLRAAGYALLCVGVATSDATVELQSPDEVYDLQFGDAFAAAALDAASPTVVRDDFALEIVAEAD